MSTQKNQTVLRWVKAKKSVVEVLRRPIKNIEKISAKALTRNRQTQLDQHTPPSQLLDQRDDYSLIKTVDGTFGWAQTKNIKILKNKDYWRDTQYFLQDQTVALPLPSSEKIRRILRGYRGVPYLWGGNTQQGLDCSAFVQKLLSESLDALLPRNSRDQSKYGMPVRDQNFCPLDTLFFVHKETRKSHVGAFFEDRVWHFCLDKRGLSAESLEEIQRRYRHIATRRLVHPPAKKNLSDQSSSKQSGVVRASLKLKISAKKSHLLAKIQQSRAIHIVGLSGTEGAAVALFLRKKKIPFVTHDFVERARFGKNFSAAHLGLSANTRAKMLKQLEALEPETRYRADYLQDIDKADLIFVSQNWEAYAPNEKLKAIFARHPARFATLTQLYFQLFPGKILAVTGTNGKSTTTKLIAEIMQAASRQKKRSSRQRVDSLVDKSVCPVDSPVDKIVCPVDKVWFTGNDRRNVQILDCLDKWSKNDWLVIEVSNRQLKFELGRAPDIAVITNVTENHLNEYRDGFVGYQKGKYSLIAKQTKADIAVLNADDPVTAKFLKQAKGTTLPYSVGKKLSTGVRVDKGKIVYSDEWTASGQGGRSSGQRVDKVVCPVDSLVDKVVCPVDKIHLLGVHNLSNVLAAIGATRSAGVSWQVIKGVVASFRGIPQRLELVARKRGVGFINDSASTSPESAIAALKSFPPRTVHLIAGGDPKGMRFDTLAEEIGVQGARVVLLRSPAAEALARALGERKIGFAMTDTLQGAVKLATSNARAGESVLLSPAAAWFCYFNGKIPLGGRGFELFVRQLK